MPGAKEQDTGSGLSMLSDVIDAAFFKSIEADGHESTNDGKIQIFIIHRSKGGIRQSFAHVSHNNHARQQATVRFAQRNCRRSRDESCRAGFMLIVE